MATAQGRVTDMTRGDPVRLLLNFSAPLFLSNLLQQFYNLADTALAGHILGDAALAQIGATAALYGLIMNFAFGMNNGLALTVSRLFGAGDDKGVRRATAWMLALAAATAAVLTAVFVGMRRPLLVLLQVPEATMEGALAYLTLILLGIPLTMAYNMEAALLRAIGNSLTPLYFLLFSTVLNIGLDIAFMGPLQLGVGGAAAATVVAQGISAVLCGWYIIRNYPALHFTHNAFANGKKFAANMFWAGLSMGLMSAIYNIGSVVLQSSINALGSTYIAAQVAARRFAELFFIPGSALGIAVATYRPPQPHHERRDHGAGHLLCVVGVRDVVRVLPQRSGGAGHHRHQRRGHHLQRGAVLEDQRPGHPAHGGAGHRAEHAAGHPAHHRAAAGQWTGTHRQGHLRRVDRARGGLHGGLLL